MGADGIHSAVRAQLMQDEAQIALHSGRPDAAEEILTSIEPFWTGSIAYRELAPLARLQKDADTRKLRIPLHPTQVQSLACSHGRQDTDVRVSDQYIGKDIVRNSLLPDANLTWTNRILWCIRYRRKI